MSSASFTTGVRDRLVISTKEWLWVAIALAVIASLSGGDAGPEFWFVLLVAGGFAVWLSWKQRILMTIDLHANEVIINGPQTQLQLKADQIQRFTFKSGSLYVQTESAEFLLTGWAGRLNDQQESAIIDMLKFAERR